MKVPLSWLRDYVDIADTVEGLSDRLTFSGIEVEGIEHVGIDCEGVIVGEVRQVARHPEADRLTICTVFDGAGEVQVVCGAPNVQEGGRYPLAPVGSRIKGGARIKKSKLRGVVSQGMLCAEDELGLSDRHEGLLDLPADSTAGTPIAEVLGPPEVVLDLEITPNRPDCLSLIGIAREVATLYGTALKRPSVTFEERGDEVADLIGVQIEDESRCPRYTARVLTGVRIGPSPGWMQRRLTLAGVRPINNVVDITNYVMLECGHPLHAFDYALLEGQRIVVRRAKPDEQLTTLDDTEQALTAEMLVIADERKALALAGVMGGAHSEIRPETGTVLLESACFTPAGIRHTSKALGLVTESSYRFARGVDRGGVDWASRRAAALMIELAEASAAHGVVDAYPAPPPACTVVCRADAVSRLLGIPVTTGELGTVFRALELDIQQEAPESCTVGIPSFRQDLTREVDLIEEYARIHGLDRIPSPSPSAHIVPDARDDEVRATRQLREALTGAGLREIMNYSLTSEGLLDRFDPASAGRRIRLPHPISVDQSTLRPSLLPQMMETLGRNHARQNEEAALFEFGRVFHQPDETGGREEDRVSIGLTGPVGRTGLNRNRKIDEEDMFLWIKGIVLRLLQQSGACAIDSRVVDQPGFAPGRAMEVRVDGEPAAVLGLAHPDLAAEWRIHEPVGLAECSRSACVRHLFDRVAVQPLAVHPAVDRDMALVADETLTHGEIHALLQRAAPVELTRIELFDIFRGGTIAPGRKSMAYSLTYRSTQRTLTDEEVNALHDGLKDVLRRELGVDVREG